MLALFALNAESTDLVSDAQGKPGGIRTVVQVHKGMHAMTSPKCIPLLCQCLVDESGTRLGRLHPRGLALGVDVARRTNPTA